MAVRVGPNPFGEILLGAAALLLTVWVASVLLCTATEDILTIP